MIPTTQLWTRPRCHLDNMLNTCPGTCSLKTYFCTIPWSHLIGEITVYPWTWRLPNRLPGRSSRQNTGLTRRLQTIRHSTQLCTRPRSDVDIGITTCLWSWRPPNGSELGQRVSRLVGLSRALGSGALQQSKAQGNQVSRTLGLPRTSDYMPSKPVLP